MSIQTDQLATSPFQLILAWAKDWPDWQRDALRRIVTNGQLSSADCDELCALCKSKRGLKADGGEVPLPVPLSADHIPSGADAASSASLVKLSALKNVNGLPGDQILEFGPSPGLTVVFGENGAGKSGYVRVLKKACRARGAAAEIKPNAFDDTADGPATAEIVFRTGTLDTPFTWTDGILGDPRLSNVFVFDAISARSHVSDDGPATFTPRGLDVLPKLARACDDLKKRLRSEAETIGTTIEQTKSNWKYKPGTAIGRLLENLNETRTDAEIEEAAEFSGTVQKRLKKLSEALKFDPKQKSQATAAAAGRIRSFAWQIEKLTVGLNDSAVLEIKSALTEAAEADTLARATAGQKFDDSFLPGTGGDSWRQLWDIARTYSITDAYPTDEFPVIESGARCVLCQQTLDAEAKTRFARFDEYVRDEAQTRAAAAKVKVAALKNDLNAMELSAPEYAKVAADLASEPAETRSEIESYSSQADARLTHVQKCLNEDSWSDPPSLPASPATTLKGIANALDERAELELSADDPETRTAMIAEQDELVDMEWLSLNKKQVLAQIARYQHVAQLKKCQDDTVTNTITIRSSGLHDALVTSVFCSRFQAERDSLGLKTLRVKLESVRGDKAERHFGLRLDANTALKVSDVASEGEHGCIALASFLAELSQASHKSALVFDDPVSSLDHKRRAAIASRLVIEAKIRQVLVFTHDLAFVCDLQVFADEQGVEIHGRHIDWSDVGPGRCHGELPWEGQKHKAQMKTLRELCEKAAKIEREQGQEEYRVFARGVCDLIRAAAERVVEEELFNHVLRRHESRIQVGRLESVGAVEPADYKAIHAVWKVCSEVIPSHSPSRAKPPDVPDAAKLKEYVGVLERVVRAVKLRRQGGQATGSTAVYLAPGAKPVTAPDTEPGANRASSDST